jgi:hypothetical protein
MKRNEMKIRPNDLEVEEGFDNFGSSTLSYHLFFSKIFSDNKYVLLKKKY